MEGGDKGHCGNEKERSSVGRRMKKTWFMSWRMLDMGRIRRGVSRHEEDWLDLAEHWPVGALQCVGGLEVVAGVGLVQAQADHLVPGRQH